MTSYTAWLTTILLGQTGCGGTPTLGGTTNTEAPTGGNSGTSLVASGGTSLVASGGTSLVALGGTSGTGGGTSICGIVDAGSLLGDGKVCVAEQPTDGPALLSGARGVTATVVDPNSVCQAPDCPVEKALDLVYQAPDTVSSFYPPQIAANSENVWVVASDWGTLLTVTPSGVSAQDLKGSVGHGTRLTVDATGALWLVSGASCSIEALRVTDHGYASVTIPTGLTHDYFGAEIPAAAEVLATNMVDGNTGYVSFHTASYEDGFHVASWDGSCWTDQTVVGPVGIITTDVNQRTWYAWVSCDPDTYTYPEETEQCTINVHSLDTAVPDEQFSYVGGADRFVPGGLQGALLSFVTANSAGISMISFEPSGTPHWVEQVVPAVTERTDVSDCPPVTLSCPGQTHCKRDVNDGAGHHYQVLQTPTGAVFAAWLEHTGHAEYALQSVTRCFACGRGTCCDSTCQDTETSGTGTVDLVIARFADPGQYDAGQVDSAQSQARFRIYAGPNMGYLSGFPARGMVADSLAVAARGDVLAVVVSTNLMGFNTLRYLEIDSTRLP